MLANGTNDQPPLSPPPPSPRKSANRFAEGNFRNPESRKAGHERLKSADAAAEFCGGAPDGLALVPPGRYDPTSGSPRFSVSCPSCVPGMVMLAPIIGREFGGGFSLCWHSRSLALVWVDQDWAARRGPVRAGAWALSFAIHFHEAGFARLQECIRMASCSAHRVGHFSGGLWTALLFGRWRVTSTILTPGLLLRPSSTSSTTTPKGRSPRSVSPLALACGPYSMAGFLWQVAFPPAQDRLDRRGDRAARFGAVGRWFSRRIAPSSAAPACGVVHGWRLHHRRSGGRAVAAASGSLAMRRYLGLPHPRAGIHPPVFLGLVGVMPWLIGCAAG